MTIRIATSGLLLCIAGCTAWHERRVTPTPQRPTVSSNTRTVPEDTLEIESGVAFDFDGNLDSPVFAKWGMSNRAEVFVGWSPFAMVERPAENGIGVGDVEVGTRYRFLEETEDSPSAAIRLATKLPTATDDQGIGSDELDFRAAGIVSKQLGDLAVTGFYQLGVLGEPGGDGTDLLHTVALAGGIPLNDRWGAMAEFSTALAVEQDIDPVVLLLGLEHSVDPYSVLDFGLIFGLNDDARDIQLFLGWTQNLGGPRR